MAWRECHLQATGFICPSGGRTERRLLHDQGHFPADRYRACNGYYTPLTGTVFEKTRPGPATPVLLQRGTAKGKPTARLARELGVSGSRGRPCANASKPI
jgi:hypothetical protein